MSRISLFGTSRNTPGRRGYTRQSSRPALRFGKHPNAKTYIRRRVVFLVALLLTLSFIGKTLLSFFGAEHVSVELSGNMHYTDVQIYDLLGKKLENIITDSEAQTAAYLKNNLGYIKEAHVTKHVMKRVLTIKITERDPFALLKFEKSPPRSRGTKNSGGIREADASVVPDSDSPFFLLDIEGHVLENIEVSEAGPPMEMVMLVAGGDVLPKIGMPAQVSGVTLGMTVLKTALRQEPALATQIVMIDAKDAEKVKLKIDALPVPVWLAADAIDSGLHHIALLLRQHKTRILELIENRSGAMPPYLDARFQGTLYLGGCAAKK